VLYNFFGKASNRFMTESALQDVNKWWHSICNDNNITTNDRK